MRQPPHLKLIDVQVFLVGPFKMFSPERNRHVINSQTIAHIPSPLFKCLFQSGDKQ